MHCVLTNFSVPYNLKLKGVDAHFRILPVIFITAKQSQKFVYIAMVFAKFSSCVYVQLVHLCRL